jgi:hypothetical protein
MIGAALSTVSVFFKSLPWETAFKSSDDISRAECDTHTREGAPRRRGKQIRMSSADAIKEFVKRHEGNRVIQKILLANNGIAAVKAMRSLRKFAYDAFGDERTFAFVAMATPEDLAANAEYIRMADHFVPVRLFAQPPTISMWRRRVALPISL